MEVTRSTALQDVLEQQIWVLEELAEQEAALQRAVAQRDWPAAESIIDGLRERADRFAGLEQVRHEAYLEMLHSVGATESVPFPVALGRLDDGSRRRLTELYRRLKAALFRVRSVSEGLDAFVAALVTTTRGILEEIYPSRKGRMYGRRGQVAGTEDWALVVNRHL
jgi:hypothetical protein